MNSEYKEKSDKAFELHAAGNLTEAEMLYKELLTISPDDINILNLYGMLCLSRKEYIKAIELLSKAVVLKKNPVVITNLAKAYFLNNEINNAIKMYITALEISPNDDTFYSLGLAYKKSGRIKDSEKSYLNALKLNPDHYGSLYNLSLMYKEMKDIKNSLEYAQKALTVNKRDEDLYTLLSGLYEEKGEYENAIRSLESAVNLNNGKSVYFYNLGVLYSKIMKYKHALDNYKLSVLLNPDNYEAYTNMASIYKDNLKDTDKALCYLEHARKINNSETNAGLMISQIYRERFDNRKSIEILEELKTIAPNNPEVYNQLAINYMDLLDYASALENYDKAIELSKNNENLNYLHGKATALKYTDDIENAKKILENILFNERCTKQAKTSLGMIYLSEKQFEKGMELYSFRSEDTKFHEIFKEKIWKKDETIAGKNILLYSDCGLGDTLMYVRYIPELQKIAKSITLQTDKELLTLLKQSIQGIKIISKTDERGEYDMVIPLMSIGWALSSDFDNIPKAEGYLSIDNDKTEKFKSLKIFNTDKLKVGICRQGNKRIYKNRSISLEELNPLLKCENTVFYSFLPNDTDNTGLISLSNYINDYSDTVSLLKCIDVLVTIDSSIVHAAGAAGIKTFLLLPHTAEWRWFNDNKITPWYNSVRIFKQKKPADWSDVIKTVTEEIKRHANQ